jgi:CRISPR type III-A-associated RAMP protein Csm4
MKYQIYKLHFTSPLHLSKGKEDYDESEELLHSDSLKAAIFVSAIQLFEDAILGEDDGKQFLQSFTISSAFPFCQDEYFFPKPFSRIQVFAKAKGKDDTRYSKRLKKIKYLGKSYFEDLLHGANGKIDEKDLSEDGNFLSEVFQSNKQKVVMASEVMQRVTIPREYDTDTDTTDTFYTERLFFADDAGLYFLVDYHGNAEVKQAVKTKVEAALHLLGDNGIGTDRSVGNGHFTFTPGSIELNVPESSNYQLNLSLYCPTRKELSEQALADASYSLLKRGGWVASPQNLDHSTLRKSTVYMFGEGSVFSTSEKPRGNIVDIKPDYQGFNHPVWRDGTALFLPLIPKKV